MRTRILQDRPAPPSPRPQPQRPVSWVRRHRLLTFFVLAYALSWWGWPLYATGAFHEGVFLPTGALLAAVIVISVADGRAGWRDLFARILRWRVAWYWYAVAIGLPLLIKAVAAFLNIGVFGAAYADLSTVAWTSIALLFAMRLVDPTNSPVGEEPAFRGYALPHLQARRSPLWSALILGVAVAGWHVPLVMMGMLGAIGLLGTVAITFVYVWLFNRTGGSVLLTLLFHAAEGSVSFDDWGFSGADLNRMETLYTIVLCAAATGVVVFDRTAWRRAPRSAIAGGPRA